MWGLLSLAGVCVGIALARWRSRVKDARLFRALALPGPVNLEPPTTAELGDGGNSAD